MVRKPIYPHELIGEKISVIKAKNKSNLGIKGIIVDETKFTIKVEKEGKIKTLMKKNITLKIEKTGQIVDGGSIDKRPEDRIKG